MDLGNFYGLKKKGTPGKASLTEKVASIKEVPKSFKGNLEDPQTKLVEPGEAHETVNADAVYAAQRRRLNIIESKRW